MKQTLEEAAHSFAESRSSGSAFPAYYQGFIAGAEWQKDISSADWRSKQSPWISVEERLPERNTIVLTKGAYGFLICYLSTLGEWETGRNVNEERLAITHWCYIPYFDNNYKSSKE